MEAFIAGMLFAVLVVLYEYMKFQDRWMDCDCFRELAVKETDLKLKLYFMDKWLDELQRIKKQDQ